MKKITSLILAAAVLLGLTACAGNIGQQETGAESSSNPAEEQKKYISELSIALEQPVIMFSPLEKSDGNHDKLYCMTYNQLLSWNWEKMELEPELATSVTMLDAHTVHICLRDDVTFSNGEKMTADDVIYSFTELMDAARELNSSVGSIAADLIKSAEKLGDYELIFHLKKDNVDFMYYLYLQSHSIFCKKACLENLKTGMQIGTGGWIMEQMIVGETCSFRKYADSWVWKIEGDTPTEKVSFYYYPEASTRAAALESGEVVSAKLGEESLLGIDTSNLITKNYAAQTLSYALFNYKYGVFAGNDEKTKNLRRAVVYAIDMNELNEIQAFSRNVQAKSMWGSAQFGLWEEFDHPFGQDLEYARECLSKSSYPYGGFTIKLVVPNQADSAWGKSAVVIQSVLKKELNINVEIENTDTTGVFVRVKAMQEGTPNEKDKFDMLIYNISLRPDGGRFSFIPNFASSTNRAMYDNAEQVELFREALTVSDVSARREIYKKIQLVWHDECVYWPWFYEASSETYWKGVSGIKINLDTKTDYHAIRMEITK